MVLDALTALSLAGTIVQFVDFSAKLLAKGNEIYASVNGASIGNNDIEAAARNIRVLNGRLTDSAVLRRRVRVEAAFESEAALIHLTTKCSAVAEELVAVLDRLKVQGGGNRRWKSFRQALKSSLAQGRVDEINSRLEALRQELSFSVLVSLREDLDLQAIKSSNGFSSLERSTQALADQLLREQKNALSDQTSFFGLEQDRTNRIVEAQHNQTRREIIATIQNERADQLHRRAQEYDDDDEDPMKAQLVSSLILESLRFQTIDDRYEEIEPAHKQTFGWIFKEPDQEKMWAHFPKWLSTGGGIYWINGKAASGKSTIMKYVYNDVRTKDLLMHWAGQQRLIQVSHYFWNSGTADQRSHVGLLRALLFKILSLCESLIPEIFPEVWKDRTSKPLFIIEEMGRISWTLSKLSQAFDRLVSSTNHGLKFCLFVDGLDEYDGDYFEVIEIFTKISDSSNVKVCLSSRPLSDFVVAFKKCQSLRLQDLTFNDIQQYINYELGTNPHMQTLRENKPGEATKLVSEIVDKADGVFLWVKLVVLSLLRGLRQSDDIRDLQVRLKLLPPSLEDLFSHILGRLDPVYLEQSSRIFQIFAEAQKVNDTSLTSLELSFAEELESGSVIREPTRQRNETELRERSSRVETWLRTRCGGLIETYSSEQACDSAADARLSYLHRTVRDFLELPEIWSIVLKPTSDKEFYPSIALLQSQVLYIKWVLPFPTNLMHRISVLQKFAKRAIGFARQAETTTGKPQVTLLQELDRVCSNLVKDSGQGSYSWTSEESNDDIDESGESWDVHRNSLLSLSIKAGLYFYVAEKLKLEPSLVQDKGGRPLLHYAVSDKNDLCIHELQLQPDMIELLLNHGARVDEIYEDVSAWELVLRALFVLLAQGASNDLVKKWLSIVKLFLEHGADPTQSIGNDPSKVVYTLVHAICDFSHEVKALLVSPGILAERAEKASRARQTGGPSVKEGFTNEENQIGTSSELLLAKEKLDSRLPDETGQVAQPVAVSYVSSGSNTTDDVPLKSQRLGEVEVPIARGPETPESQNQSMFQGSERRTMPVIITTHLDEPNPDSQSQGQRTSSQLHDGLANTVTPNQIWVSASSQWSFDQVSIQLPPPIPPKIPILMETCYELQGSPVPASDSSPSNASQPFSYPFWPSAERTSPAQWETGQLNQHNPNDSLSPIDVGALHPRPRSAQAFPSALEEPSRHYLSHPTSPSQWERGRQSQHNPNNSLSPTDVGALHPRPRSAQAFPSVLEEPNRRNLSHPRSFNSLSSTPNISSRTYHCEQYNYLPYSPPPIIQRPSHPPPVERHDSPPSYYSQPSPKASSPRRQFDVSHVVHDPTPVASNLSSSYSQTSTLPPPLPLPPRPAQYLSHQFAQAVPSSISSPYQNNQVYPGRINPYLPNPHQIRPQHRFPPQSQPFNNDVRNQHMSRNPNQNNLDAYRPSLPQRTAPSLQPSTIPSQNGNPTFYTPAPRPESAPVQDSRPKNWMERLTKSFRT